MVTSTTQGTTQNESLNRFPPSLEDFDPTPNYREAAIEWFKFGLKVIPIAQDSKHSAVTWNGWLEGLSVEKITAHWTQYPKHEVGFIVSDDLIVFDADSGESTDALNAIQTTQEIRTKLIVKTKKGVHHYFRRASGTYSKSDSHSTEVHPDRIDVKTGRALVVLPPSSWKSVLINEAVDSHGLSEVNQDFIDAVFEHNGRQPPRPDVTPEPSETEPVLREGKLAQLEALLNHIDPDAGYQDWFNCGVAIFHETDGSDEGLALFDKWSKRGRKYPGSKEVAAKWRSFRPSPSNPITIGTLKMMVADQGGDWVAICDSVESKFIECEMEVITPDTQPVSTSKQEKNPLEKFSLRGMYEEIEKSTVAEIPLLGKVALQGQFTVWYAAPNTGKTLLAISLLTEGIQEGKVNPFDVHYFNLDDNGKGLLAKLQIADEYGFNMIAEGYRGFTAENFLEVMSGLSKNDQAKSQVILVDTLKKVADLMDKRESSKLTKTIRAFVLKGGTVIALAHTNKNPGKDGKPIYGGVSDILNDADCSYIIRPLPTEPGSTDKVVEFENIKARGGVVQSAAYSYSREDGISYNEILLSVKPVEEEQLQPLKKAEAMRSDAEVIEAVKACIKEGIITKMKLSEAAAIKVGISKKAALKVIEKYTGEDPTMHQWKFSVRDRGAKVYSTLDTATLH